LYKKLEKRSKNIKSNEKKLNSLFNEFENPVNTMQIIDSKKPEKNSIADIINKSIQSVIEDIATQIINTESSFLQSKNVEEMAKSIENFFKKSNLGSFEYIQKTGKNIFRVNHFLGTNGTEFFKNFYEKLFQVYLKNYSFYLISNESYVCVIFR
jgi:hypothetical protein